MLTYTQLMKAKQKPTITKPIRLTPEFDERIAAAIHAAHTNFSQWAREALQEKLDREYCVAESQASYDTTEPKPDVDSADSEKT